MIKKAAMFGLDARIALAIFGALSVISGAALYSAIQESKVTQLITNLNELGKAYEAFILDTGQELPIVSSDVYGESRYLIEDNSSSPIKGWNGPYMQSDGIIGESYLKHSIYKSYALIDFAEDSDWTNVKDNRASGAQCITTKTTCWAWARIQGDFKLSLMKAVDMKIDGNDSAWTGNFRYRFKSDKAYQEAYLKYMPAYHQPNL